MMVATGNLLDEDSQVVAFWYFECLRVILLAAARLTVLIRTDEKDLVDLHLNWQLVNKY